MRVYRGDVVILICAALHGAFASNNDNSTAVDDTSAHRGWDGSYSVLPWYTLLGCGLILITCFGLFSLFQRFSHLRLRLIRRASVQNARPNLDIQSNLGHAFNTTNQDSAAPANNGTFSRPSTQEVNQRIAVRNAIRDADLLSYALRLSEATAAEEQVTRERENRAVSELREIEERDRRRENASISPGSSPALSSQQAMTGAAVDDPPGSANSSVVGSPRGGSPWASPSNSPAVRGGEGDGEASPIAPPSHAQDPSRGRAAHVPPHIELPPPASSLTKCPGIAVTISPSARVHPDPGLPTPAEAQVQNAANVAATNDNNNVTTTANPSTTITSTSGKRDEVKVLGECIICLCEIWDTDRVITLDCMHVFHAGCINTWTTKNPVCPTCLTPCSKRLT